jgi:hypothetical protein
MGNVQNIIIVSKINFRFLGNRQVEHMRGIQLVLGLKTQLSGNTNTHCTKPEHTNKR